MISNRTRITAVPALVATGLVASLPFALKAAAHQDAASPEATAVSNPFADLGLPEINLTLTAEAVEGMPESVEAGRYVLTVGGEPSEEDFALGAMFLQLPEGLSLEDAMAQAGENPDMPPAFYYESVLAGGKAAMVAIGETSAVSVIELTPGEWLVAGQQLSRPPVPFTVTGEMAADAAEPESTVSMEMGEMYFELTEGSLVAGENIIKLTNAGAQPHFVEVMGVPEGTTNDNIEAVIAQEMGGTPEAEPLDFEQTMPVAYLSEQSAGVTSWAPLTLEAGTYAVMCWVADPETGMPHAMMGMHDVYVVE